MEFDPQQETVRCTVGFGQAATTLSIPLAPSVLRRLKLASAMLEPSATKEWGATAHQALEELHSVIFERLWRPAAATWEGQPVHGVAIVSHDVLGRVPFHLMRDSEGRAVSEQLALTYLPALALLDRDPLQEPRGGPVTMLVDPEENLLIARVVALGLQRLGVEVFAGPQVTRAAFLEALQQPGLLLLCCHADQWGLRLADGLLAPSALKEQPLQSRRAAVALIACRGGLSAFGPIPTGAQWPEALLRRGTPAVVAASWQIPELSAVLFADQFLRAWLQGERPSQAYRQAVQAVAGCTLATWDHWCQLQVLASQEFAAKPSDTLWFQVAVAKDLVTFAEQQPGAARVAIQRRALALLQRTYTPLMVERDSPRLPEFEVKALLTALRRVVPAGPAPAAEGSVPLLAHPMHWALLRLFALPD